MPTPRPYGFVKAMEFTLPYEAGKNRDGTIRKDGGLTTDTGGVTKWGISEKGNGIKDGKWGDTAIPDLTIEQATDYYKANYWDVYVSLRPVSANLDNLPVALAVAVFDTGVNCGTGRCIAWLGKALEAKNPTKALLDLRSGYYFNLVSADRTKYGAYYKGWTNRLADLRKYVDVLEQQAQNSYDVLEAITGQKIGQSSGNS